MIGIFYFRYQFLSYSCGSTNLVLSRRVVFSIVDIVLLLYTVVVVVKELYRFRLLGFYGRYGLEILVPLSRKQCHSQLPVNPSLWAHQLERISSSEPIARASRSLILAIIIFHHNHNTYRYCKRIAATTVVDVTILVLR